MEQSGNSGIKNKQNDSVNHKFICGLKEYKQLWNFEVVDNNQKPAYLYNILNKKVKLEKIHGFDEKKFNEHYSKKRGTDAVSFLKDIYKNLRNPLVHGSRSHINDDSVAFAYHFMKACSRAIVEFVQNPVSLDEENTNNQKNNKKNHNNEFTVYKKLVRKKPRYTDETLKKNSTKKKKADKAAGNCQESE